MASSNQRAAAQVADEELVEAVLGGDENAFEALYERYFPRIYSFVDRRLRNRADTEEVAQEVFFNVFSSLPRFRGEAPFAAWVFGLTRRTIAARFKKKRHETVTLAEEDSDHAAGVFYTTVRRAPDPHEVYECNERLGRMQSAASNELTGEQWLMFRLHHLQNRSIQEIAQQVSKSEDAVKSHLYRARKVLLAR